MTLQDALLFANEAFYQAFSARDADALIELWDDQEECMCVHPGWNALFGVDAIIHSFESIFSGPAPPQIICHVANSTIMDGSGIVVCYEEIGAQVLVATNVFKQRGSKWLLVLHHAGPAQFLPKQTASEDDPRRAN